MTLFKFELISFLSLFLAVYNLKCIYFENEKMKEKIMNYDDDVDDGGEEHAQFGGDYKANTVRVVMFYYVSSYICEKI